MHHYSNKNTIRHFHPPGKVQNNTQQLIQKNIALEKRLTILETTLNQLESKAFEANVRISQAELRAGRSDMRASEASQRAGYAQERAVEAMAALERAAAAVQVAERAEERAIRLELKWMKITGIIKMPFKIIRLIIDAPKRLLGKTNTASSIADAEKTPSSQETTNIAPGNKDEPLSPSLRARQIYQNLKTPDTQDRDSDRCE